MSNKKRQPNFTADEIKVLVRGVERNGKVLTSSTVNKTKFLTMTSTSLPYRHHMDMSMVGR